jgi:hypothetical protein
MNIRLKRRALDFISKERADALSLALSIALICLSVCLSVSQSVSLSVCLAIFRPSFSYLYTIIIIIIIIIIIEPTTHFVQNICIPGRNFKMKPAEQQQD